MTFRRILVVAVLCSPAAFIGGVLAAPSTFADPEVGKAVSAPPPPLPFALVFTPTALDFIGGEGNMARVGKLVEERSWVVFTNSHMPGYGWELHATEATGMAVPANCDFNQVAADAVADPVVRRRLRTTELVFLVVKCREVHGWSGAAPSRPTAIRDFKRQALAGFAFVDAGVLYSLELDDLWNRTIVFHEFGHSVGAKHPKSASDSAATAANDAGRKVEPLFAAANGVVIKRKSPRRPLADILAGGAPGITNVEFGAFFSENVPGRGGADANIVGLLKAVWPVVLKDTVATRRRLLPP